MPDIYQNFAELSADCVENEDYMIHSFSRQSPVLSMAIHGGGIERGSGEIARAVSIVGGFNFYEFEGIRGARNMELHVTSSRFNEPTMESMLSHADRVLSFHGVKGKDERFTMLGGLDAELREAISE